MVKRLAQSFLGAVAFYTILPIPSSWKPEFRRIARWAPLVGILLGGVLGLFDFMIFRLGMPRLTQSALTVALWVALTGGLHLDGAIDTADGLAVAERQQCLKVMNDSVTGAFGVMVAGIILLLKTAALSEISGDRWFGLMAVAGWGRWGQVAAIAYYPYLKATGKGAFHKQTLQLPKDIILGLMFLLGLSGLQLGLNPSQWWIGVGTTGGGSAFSLLTGWWIGQQLGGHTGDTYGAVVEWTETFLLCLYTCLV